MDENTWRFAQLMMWLIGIQTALLTAILGVIWSKLNRMEDRQIKTDEKLSDVDKRVFGIETMLHMKDCCVLKEAQKNKKAE
jgi:hypothetical protein